MFNTRLEYLKSRVYLNLTNEDLVKKYQHYSPVCAVSIFEDNGTSFDDNRTKRKMMEELEAFGHHLFQYKNNTNS